MKSNSDGPKYPEKMEHIDDFFKTVHSFLQERPVKGILQSIDEFFKHPFPYSSFPVDVRETNEKHVVTAELPGINKEQIGLDILGNTLTISINRQEIQTEEDDRSNLYRRSESLSRISRTISFPFPIDERNVTASYRDGLLKVSIPKLHGKRIDIIE